MLKRVQISKGEGEYAFSFFLLNLDKAAFAYHHTKTSQEKFR